MRKLIINNKEYLWRCGKENIVIKLPSGKKIAVPLEKIPNIPEDIERASWKKSLHITPGDVSQYIEEGGF